MRPRVRRGFTLLEVAVVLAITAIGALLVLPRWNGPRPMGETAVDGRGNEVPGDSLVALFQAARRHARREQLVVTVYIDAANNQVRLDTAGAAGAGRWLDGPVPLTEREWLEPRDQRATFVFDATGAVLGDSLLLRTAQGRYALLFDPWHGEVIRRAH